MDLTAIKDNENLKEVDLENPFRNRAQLNMKFKKNWQKVKYGT